MLHLYPVCPAAIKEFGPLTNDALAVTLAATMEDRLDSTNITSVCNMSSKKKGTKSKRIG